MSRYRAYVPEISLECDADNEHDAEKILYKKLLEKIRGAKMYQGRKRKNNIIVWKPIDYIDEDGNNIENK